MSDETRALAGRQLAALRRRETRSCPVCGRAFETVVAVGRGTYCSTVCRVKAWRKLKRERATADGDAQPPAPSTGDVKLAKARARLRRDLEEARRRGDARAVTQIEGLLAGLDRADPLD